MHFQIRFFISPMMLLALFTSIESLALPGCPGECGNLSIPFPFGIASNCYLDDSFLIICNSSFHPPKPFLRLQHAEVLSISLDGKIKILNSSSELMQLEKRDMESVPVVIEWAAGNVACHVARNNASHYACQSQHSKCTDSSIGRGHICHCLPGYEGNPYILDGCQDIDECAVMEPCAHVCINLPGSFKCYCPEGLIGDGRKDGSGCHPKDQVTLSSHIYFPLGIIVLAPALASTWIIWIHKEKKLAKHRQNVFQQNGGKVLRMKISRLKEPAREQIKVYTADEMKAATNNYRSRIVYISGPEPCYCGKLAGDNNTETEVLIMQIPGVHESQIDQFVDQLIFLSQPHKNLVKIIGCCLETEFPLLVYELHGEGTTLYNHVYDEDVVSHLSCRERVKAAAGAARALIHLHSQNSRSIAHGNVSSANIHVDASNDAKLLYVVASNLACQEIHSPGQAYYMHRPPEFSNSGQLNMKSDVYNFGMLLSELLIGWNTSADQQMKAEIATLAERCLNEKPEKRPNMKEVEAKLSTFCTQT